MSGSSTIIPELQHISLTRPILPPSKKIRNDSDVETWKGTTGYKDYCLWVVRLNNSVIGYDNPTVSAAPKSEVSVLATLCRILLLTRSGSP
jgi:serine/threonine-protein phosphatase 2A activator